MLKFGIPEPKWQALRNLKNIHFYVGDQDELGTGLRHRRKDSKGRGYYFHCCFKNEIMK